VDLIGKFELYCRVSAYLNDVDYLLPEALRITVFTMSLVLANLLSVSLFFPALLGLMIPGLALYFQQQVDIELMLIIMLELPPCFKLYN
jgi:hypothetical protein